MTAHLVVSVKDPKGNRISDLQLLLMNISAKSGLTDVNGEVHFDVFPNTDGYIYFYNPNVEGYTRKDFTTGNNDTITMVDMTYLPYLTSVPNQTVLTKDFLIGAICIYCKVPIKLGDKFVEIEGKLSHYECFLSHIKRIYQKNIDITLKKISNRKLRMNDISSKKPKCIIDIIDMYLKELGFVTQKGCIGLSSSTTNMDIWDFLVYRPKRGEYIKALMFDIIGLLHVGYPEPVCPVIINIHEDDIQNQIDNLMLIKNVEHKIIISEKEFTADGVVVKTVNKFGDYLERIIRMEKDIKGICG